jgi:prolyl-tRNA synthetase
MAQDAVFMARRDKPANEKQSLPRAQFIEQLPALLDEIQHGLLQRARDFRAARTREIDSKDELYHYFTEEPNAGFALTHWSGDPAIEAQLKQDLSVTLRCIPLEASAPGTCPFTGQPSKLRVVWAKSY